MPRTFTAASSHKIILGLGQLGFAFGPGTIALIARATTDANMCLFSAGPTSGSANRYQLQRVVTSGVIRLVCDVPTSDGATAMTAGAWYLIAASKASGTAAARIHLYAYATNTWTHENGGTAIANSGVANTQANIGCSNAAANFANADIAAVGVWNVALTDSQVEALAYTLPAWFAVQPKGLWILDQAATAMGVPDLSGGGANQTAITGTAVSTLSLPVFSYGHRIASAV